MSMPQALARDIAAKGGRAFYVGGVVRDARVYTDAMDHALADRLQTALVGQPFEAEALNKALSPLPCGTDVFSLLSRAL